MRRLAGALAAGLGVLLLFILLARPAQAHVKSTTGYSQIRSADGGEVRYELHLEYAPLVNGVEAHERRSVVVRPSVARSFPEAVLPGPRARRTRRRAQPHG